jgi:hypothetical protein
MRIKRELSQALIIDIQEKLLPHVLDNQLVLCNNEILVKGLQLLDVPITISEQYPNGLGQTVYDLKKLLNEDLKFEKRSFSCFGESKLENHILSSNKRILIVSGLESHVCVLQTVLDSIELGLLPVVVVDCVGSRNSLDHQIAISRLEKAGAILTTHESLLFELCQTSDNKRFKEISNLIK